MCFEVVLFSVAAWFMQGFGPHAPRLRMRVEKQHVLIKQVMQVAVRASNERRRFEPTCMIVNSIHLRGLHD
jgi:hypothetical protein